MKLRVAVSGMVGAVPGQGGATWAVLQYVLGLRRLGHEVLFVEEIPTASRTPHGAPLHESANARYTAEVFSDVGAPRSWALVGERGSDAAGFDIDTVRRWLASADVVLNLSGVLRRPDLHVEGPQWVFVDLDPAFNQLWHESGIDLGFDLHDRFVTVGLGLGGLDCPVPTCGRQWLPTVQPVVLDRWPVATSTLHDAFTTVANWRGYGSVEHEGRHYGQRAHSLRPLFGLPAATDDRCLLALAIDPGEIDDVAALARHGWELLDPAEVASTPAAYQRFVAGSMAELCVAKSGYVVGRTGWFSDRSICYLASGRPVVAQDTGFSGWLPCGEGLVPFVDVESAAAAMAGVRADYDRHAKAARGLAEEVFESDRVLLSLLDRLSEPVAR